jgi:hyperosmotically inducible periplasmic protein
MNANGREWTAIRGSDFGSVGIEIVRGTGIGYLQYGREHAAEGIDIVGAFARIGKGVRIMRTALVCLMIVGFVLSAGAADRVPTSVRDASITARIETMYLLNEHLSPFNINTTTKNGVVTLTGGVGDNVKRDLAVDLAQSVDGVSEVVNHLKVVKHSAGTQPSRSFRQIVRDKTTSASIRSRLLYHKEFSGFNISVQTISGNVTLSGVVATEDEAKRVVQIASGTRGVNKVMSNLVARAKEKREPMANVSQQFSDEWVEKRVETALLMNRHINLRDLNVEVDDGLCILTGSVDTDVQRKLTESITKSIQGVGTVRNDIKVRKLILKMDLLEFEE